MQELLSNESSYSNMPSDSCLETEVYRTKNAGHPAAKATVNARDILIFLLFNQYAHGGRDYPLTMPAPTLHASPTSQIGLIEAHGM